MEQEQGNLREESPQEFARRVKLPFVNIGLLTRALTHRSYMNEYKDALEDNERLEFLGDAVLDFLVGAWLYNRFPEMAEGQLTRLRAALVGNQELADFAREIDIGAAMRLGRGEAENGGRDRPALLGATFEAIVGALYLDSGILPVRNFVEPLLEVAIQKILAARLDHDAKSQLQEWSQAQAYGPPIYRTVSDSGPDHDKCFIVEVIINGQVCGQGSGHSKQAAAKAAAQTALNTLGIE
jgi:ribonuclease III